MKKDWSLKIGLEMFNRKRNDKKLVEIFFSDCFNWPFVDIFV